MNKFLEKFKIKSKGTQTHSAFNPEKHWIILLSAFFVLLTLTILLNLYFLFQIRNGKIFQAKVTLDNTPTLNINEDILKSVSASFGDKAKKEAELIANPPVYQDPSL